MTLLFTFINIIIFIINTTNINAITYGCFENKRINIEIISKNIDILFINLLFPLKFKINSIMPKTKNIIKIIMLINVNKSVIKNS